MNDTTGVPDADHLRTSIQEQARLLTGPDVSDVVRVRVRRALHSAGDLLELSGAEPARDVAARTVAWLAESVGAFQRLPHGFAGGHAVEGEPAPLLRIVDELDLLGLTLDHAYDATRRGDDAALDRQLDVLRERYAVRTSPAAVVRTAVVPPTDVDQEVVADRGLEVGADGIPRVPVPDQPDAHHETQEPAR
ncbi:hypothetical protein [Ornithinimicrobium pekingense]|uniref:DUF222 domain-containing protein n=1 Tax=Ornithinimicrobium pekingense TaxID=384677 RepID=A0ABQ2F704_9MICO|nr:hypothetical protein [Ornithinimicrobium pekingense]GGK68200.1 hypothetical protein GCM10011509_15710 [Ornithinimicrobium pekingense]